MATRYLICDGNGRAIGYQLVENDGKELLVLHGHPVGTYRPDTNKTYGETGAVRGHGNLLAVLALALRDKTP